MSSAGPSEAIVAINACVELTLAEKAAVRSMAIKDINVAQGIVATPAAERAATIRDLLKPAGAVGGDAAAVSIVRSAKLTELERVCIAAGKQVDPRVIQRIRRLPVLQNALLLSPPSQYVEVYEDAEKLLGTSTKNCIVAVDEQLSLSINGLFEEACNLSESSTFYHAWLNGSPCLLKLPKSEEVAELEAAIYQAVPDELEGKKRLVKVTLLPIKLKLTSGSHGLRALSSNKALHMQRFDSTLAKLPSEVKGLHIQLLRAAEHVAGGLEALHAAQYVHCDVKPGNIFSDAGGACFLGDYDGGVKRGRLVRRTTSTYLPAEFAELHTMGQLMAVEAVDWAMLAYTLAERMALPMTRTREEAHPAVAGAPSHAASSPLFFSQPAFLRSLPALLAAVDAEADHVGAILSKLKPSAHSKDVEARHGVLRAIRTAADKITASDGGQIKQGAPLAQAKEALLHSRSLASLPVNEVELSNRTWTFDGSLF